MLSLVAINHYNPIYTDILDYMDRIGYYHIARINGFDYWARKDTHAVYYSPCAINDDYSTIIADDNMPLTFYCYRYMWENSAAYLSGNSNNTEIAY